MKRALDWLLDRFEWVLAAELAAGMALIAWKNGIS